MQGRETLPGVRSHASATRFRRSNWHKHWNVNSSHHSLELCVHMQVIIHLRISFSVSKFGVTILYFYYNPLLFDYFNYLTHLIFSGCKP